MKRQWIEFLVFFSILLITGFLAYYQKTHQYIYSLTFNLWYIAAVFVSLTYGFLVILQVRPFNRVYLILKKELANLFFFLIFLPIAVFPLIYCYFKVPYLFCHVCPRRCIFGHIRAYVIPALLVMNVENRFWCYNWCPIGKLHDAQHLLGKMRRYQRMGSIFRYMVLIFIVVTYFLILGAEREFSEGGSLYIFMFKNTFSISAIVLWSVLGIFIIGFFVQRVFCDFVCPVGAVSDLALKLQKPHRALK